MAAPRITKQQALPRPPSYWFGLIPIALQLVLITFFWWRLPPQIPLYYSLAYGFSRLAPKLLIFLLPGLSLSAWLVESIIFRPRTAGSIYAHVQFWLTQLILLLLTIAVGHIVFIVS